jgi:tetratricopeptide (TPR) repeat protein
MTNDEWFIKAVAYFDGSMTNEEARAFELETAADEELSELMKLWKQTDAEASAYEKFKPEIEAFVKTHQHLKKEFIGRLSPVRYANIWKWTAAAAVLTGLILIGNMLLHNSENKTEAIVKHTTADSLKKTGKHNTVPVPDQQSPAEKNQTDLQALYAQYFAPDKVPDDPNGPLDDAYFFYESRQYEKAITAIDSLSKKKLTRGGGATDASTNTFALYYKALSLMSTGRAESAIPLLAQVEVSGEQALKVKAQWYLCLAYLKNEQPGDAINKLQALMKDPSSNVYKNKARKLLADLRK